MNEKEFQALHGKKAFYKPDYVADDILDCSLSHVYALIDREELGVNRDREGFKLYPIRIKRASILAYLNQGE